MVGSWRRDVPAAHARHDAVAGERQLVERHSGHQVLGEVGRGEGHQPLVHLGPERGTEQVGVEVLHEVGTHVGLLEHVGEQVVEVDDLDPA